MPHPLESNTQSGMIPKTYEVTFKIEVPGRTPEEAAKIARDMLLDPDTNLAADVRKLYWHEDACDWFPNEDEGMNAYFGDYHRRNRYRGAGPAPVETIAHTSAAQ